MLNLSIGQGETLVTPVQAARYMSALAVGSLPTPHVLLSNTPGARSTPVSISDKTLEQIRSILLDVVESPYGTGKRARVSGVRVAGKTGTAQNSHGEDHAWFVAFAPVDAPRIVVAVVAENAGQGSEVAAPICREVLEAFFRDLPGQPRPEVAVASAAPPGASRARKTASSDVSKVIPAASVAQIEATAQ